MYKLYIMDYTLINFATYRLGFHLSKEFITMHNYKPCSW